MISAIVAADPTGVIGHQGGLPWGVRYSSDRRWFRERTAGHALIMGRTTHEDVARVAGGPLGYGRTTIVLSSQKAPVGMEGRVYWGDDLASAVTLAQQIERFHGRDEVIIAGGLSVYTQALPMLDRIYFTLVPNLHSGDVILPASYLDGFDETDRRTEDGCHFITYDRRKTSYEGHWLTLPGHNVD